MAKVLNLSSPIPSISNSSLSCSHSSGTQFSFSINYHSSSQSWSSLQQKLKCNGRLFCLFSKGRQEFDASRIWDDIRLIRKMVGLDGVDVLVGLMVITFGKKPNKQLLTVLGIIIGYLIVAKGELLLTVIFNPLLYALRRTRNGLSFTTSKVLQSTAAGNQPAFNGTLKKENYHPASAKDNVIRKWGSE